MNEMYVKNSSPTITRQVISNVIEAMESADLNVIHIDTLRQIVAECDRTLADWIGRK